MTTRHQVLLAAALDYAAQGLYVVPLHEPLFDKAGKVSGCTCEAYKRSAKYKAWLTERGQGNRFDPAYKCRAPGKHPRLTDWESAASTDPDQVRTWWQRWPTANIGLAAGKSGLITFDLDSYKDTYGDDGDLFTLEDKQTTTQLSGGGGEHLIFQMPAGKAYTNANNSLPAGIDIRGVGGMLVLAPSLHPSSRLYEWEDGYSIFECAPRPLPAALQTILDTAHQHSAPTQAATFTTTTTARPELIRWRISKTVRELINSPAPSGQRSEADMRVITSLVYAGAGDDDILAVFQHYPIGTAGKFAEAGPGYLARTIGKARAYVAAHPRSDIGATITQLRLWIRTHSFEAHIDPKFLASDGTYRTDGTDTKVADAVFDVMEAAGMLAVNVGKKRLGQLAGVSCNTALKALTRLNGWLFTVTPDQHGALVALVEESRLKQIDPLLSIVSVDKGDQSSKNDSNQYSAHKADEPFLLGTSRYVKEQVQKTALALEISPKLAKAEYTFASLGETGIRVLDALVRCGDMTAAELKAETGKKLSSIRTACKRLAQHGVIEATREGANGPKVYNLAPDCWAKVSAAAPHLRTYRLVDQRENKRLRDAQQWCERGIEQAKAAQDAERTKQLERRKAKLAAQRLPHLVRLLEGKATQEEIKAIAYTPNLPFGPHPAQQAKLERLHAQARMDLAEARHKAKWETARLIAENIAALKASNTPKRQWFGMLTTAGFTEGEAKRAIKLGGAA